MAVFVQTRTFFILTALLGRFVTIKAQEVEEYEGGEFLSTSKTSVITPLFACSVFIVWFGYEAEWKTSGVRESDFSSHILRRGQRGVCAVGFWANSEVCGAGRGHGAGGAGKGQVLSPRPGGAAAAAEFPTKERAWDAPGGQLGKRAGRVNTEASQGGVVCAELHLLSHILCFRETQKRGFSLFHPSPCSFSFPSLSSRGSFPRRLLRRGCPMPRMAQSLPRGRGWRSGASSVRAERCEPQRPSCAGCGSAVFNVIS